ncbi:hypothetical protein ACQKKX_09975 [Neorhizobium sp. NPDC001467]|uniref:hypothetical protein n=1 Tax=Neorhizobium sp. NPDC001467 TaxID=3390595 RepID=UPI003D00BD5D
MIGNRIPSIFNGFLRFACFLPVLQIAKKDHRPIPIRAGCPGAALWATCEGE